MVDETVAVDSGSTDQMVAGERRVRLCIVDNVACPLAMVIHSLL
jgi:hypothetical protein